MSRHETGKMIEVLAILVLAIFTLASVNSYLLRTSSLAAVVSAVLVDLTNGDRNSDHLGGLVISPVLTAAAQAKADDMAAKGYFAHISPDGKNSWYWFKQAGYSFLYAGENLAVDFTDSTDVEDAWMQSKSHRANILNSNFTQVGIATAHGTFEGHDTTFVVSMFGTPAAFEQVAPVLTVSSPVEPTETALATSKPVAKAPKPIAAATTSVVTIVTNEASSTPVVSSSTALAAIEPPITVLGVVADSILPPQTSWWERLLVSPKVLLEYAYLFLGGAILILLAYVTQLELHRRHIKHVSAVAFLIVLMACLFTLANLTFFSEPVIAAQSQ